MFGGFVLNLGLSISFGIHPIWEINMHEQIKPPVRTGSDSMGVLTWDRLITQRYSQDLFSSRHMDSHVTVKTTLLSTVLSTNSTPVRLLSGVKQMVLVQSPCRTESCSAGLAPEGTLSAVCPDMSFQMLKRM